MNYFADYFLESNHSLAERMRKALSDGANGGHVSVATICTGWGVGDMCIDCISDYLERNFPGVPQAADLKTGLANIKG